jgi:hypothetical protein
MESGWISGFCDGEGCFTIQVSTRKSKKGFRFNLTSMFRIFMSASEREILEQTCQELGVGRVPDSKGYTTGYGKLKWPRATYIVSSLPECLVLRDFFNSHPLHTKKKETFEHWSQCLDLMQKSPLTREDLKKILLLRDKMNPGNKRQHVGKSAYRDAQYFLKLLDKGTCQLSLGAESPKQKDKNQLTLL